MTLTELLPLLKPSRSVLVTGPQRSGTTIAARMIAEDLGYRYADEEEIEIHNPILAVKLLGQVGVVLQAPGICHKAHSIGKRMGIPVVLMRRNLADIHASEERIGWRTAYGGLNLRAEQDKYDYEFGLISDDMAQLKYYCWDEFQKDQCTSFDLDYESLKQHPLWVSERGAFAPRQTA